MADVYLHVGLYKTGTTTIQGALAATAQRLAADGVLYPGDQRAQRLAAYDLLGQRVGGEDRGEAAGALGRLLDVVAAHPGPTVVVSEEELSLARPRHARRLVRELAGHRVFVVVGARDMARTLVSAWQQTIVNGGTTSWGDFIASVRGEDGAPPSEGISFHWRHDLLRVVDTWASAVPRENIRLVTVPPGARRERRCWRGSPRQRASRLRGPGWSRQSATSPWGLPSWRWCGASTSRWPTGSTRPSTGS